MITRHLVLSIICVAVAQGGLAQTAHAQLRDSFEGRERTWQILNEADCGVRILTHERVYRDSHSGQGCEHLRLAVGSGTFLPLVHPLGHAPLIAEFRPKLFVKSDRPNLQFMVRVVFPRNLDRGTGRPITALLRGDMYTDVGQWQQLHVREPLRLLEQETRQLRTRFGSDIDSREAYADLVVLNAYSMPGPIQLWIDDLEIDGYVNLDAQSGPQVNRQPLPGESAIGGAPLPPLASVEGSLVMLRGRPQMLRVVAHRGEPFEWLKSLGFNAIKLGASPSIAELNEARRLDIGLICPPPYGDLPLSADQYAPVIAWSLGARLTDRDVPGTRDLATEIRNLDPQRDRPLLVSADNSLAQYSRLAHLLAFEQTALGSTQELADFRTTLMGRARQARPGMPVLATIPRHFSARLNEQLLQLGGGAVWHEDVDPQQIRLAAYHALAAGARGLVFGGDRPLAIDTPSAALRTDSIRLLILELRLLEPWIAGGHVSEELAATDGTVQGSLLTIDRSRLLLLTQAAAAQQYVLGAPPRKSLSVVVPGVGISDKAYLINYAGATPLAVSHSSGGARITLDDAPHAAAIVITQDHLAMHHVYRTLADIKDQACRMHADMTARRLAHTSEIDRRLTDLGHPLAGSQDLLQQAAAAVDLAQRLVNGKDYTRAADATSKAEQMIARVRRGHWEQTAAAFSSPAASPCVAQFTTLPLHWQVSARLRERPFGPNVQAAGDMESLDAMLKAGWQQLRASESEIASDVSLSLAEPHTGRSALRLQAWPNDPKRVPTLLERAPVMVVSSPVPVRQGQTIRIHGWINVPKRLAATSDGLLILDSLGGLELADRIRQTQGWREFTLYRAVPQNGDFTITFALTALGEASLDDLSISLLDPDPIKPR